jgi:hypothetical protein
LILVEWIFRAAIITVAAVIDVRRALGALVEDRPDEIEARSCSEQRCDSGRIVGRRDLDKVDAVISSSC